MTPKQASAAYELEMGSGSDVKSTKARKASFDEITQWLISKSGTYKSEYIQASIVMLREMFETEPKP